MILVFGKTGQVARELARCAPDATFLARADADLSDAAACLEAVLAHRPSAVINAAAYTAVDAAEEDEPAAMRINGEAPGAMARGCAQLGIPLVHISTDYVFDGTGDEPAAPATKPHPINVYGRSKLAGEEAVRRSGAAFAILRTSWVFSASGSNFAKTMLRLSEQHQRISVVADQIGGPTPARAIAQACLALATALAADASRSGIYHFSGSPDVSWADFAREVFIQVRRSVEVENIATEAYPTRAARPRNSRLECSSLSTVSLERPDWRLGLTDVLSELNFHE